MRKDNLKNVMRKHIEKKSLTDEQLASLMKIQNNKDVKQKRYFNLSYRWVTVAAIFVVVSNVLYFTLSPQLPLDQRIGSEVAKNHINLKPLEIQTSNIQDIRKFLTELDFSPIESALLKGGSKSLIGGRYCSIQGVTAAQLRLKDSQTGQIQSLYQTVYDPKVFSNLPRLEENQKPITVYSKGLAVEIWVEKGLLFALTKETNK